MKWFIMIFLELVFQVLCILTNPFVCLMADEKGELHSIWHYWQTEDNTLDVRWVITEGCVPVWFRYDYDKHYIYHYEDKEYGRMIPGYVDLIGPEFTIKERLQRYGCRLYWLYRNCNGGFTYRFNSRDYNGNDNHIVIDIVNGSRRLWISYIIGENIWTTTWCIYVFWPWCRWFAVRSYLGWKLMGNIEPYNMRASIAVFFSPFRKWEE